MKTAGYSGTSLAKKLGIKENFTIKLVHAPDYYFNLFSDFPSHVKIITDNRSTIDFIHCLPTNAKELSKKIRAMKNQLHPDGMIWISWYKKSSKIPTDLDENFIRTVAIRNGLVDVKVCAVDEKWSALKLVIPIRERKVGR